MIESTTSHLLTVLLLVIMSITVWTDLQHNRIPNIVSLGGIILGTVVHTYTSGIPGLISGLGGAAVGMGIFLPFYLSHGMGAGDVKLMGAVGAFLGPKYALLATGLSLGAGGILAILILIIRGGFKPLAERYMATLKCLFVTGKVSHMPPAPGEVAAMKYPYATAIGIGTLVTLWWSTALQGLTDFILLPIK